MKVSTLKQHSLLYIAFLLSIVLNFYHLDYQSVWLDEIHSLNEANPSASFSDVYVNLIKGEQMPPLYYYFLHYVFKIFGYTALAGRSLSAFIAILCIYAIYLLGKSLFNKQVGQMAALFLSVNQFHIYYAQEMRPYVLFELFTILSFHRFIIFLRNPDFKNSVLYGIISGLTLYVHFFGLFTIAAQYLILLFFFIVQKDKRRYFLLLSTLSGIIMLALFIPVIPIFLNILKIKVFWVADPTPDILYLIFRDFFGRSLELLLFVVVVSIVFYRRSYKEFKLSSGYNELLNNKFAFSFIILTGWLVVVLLLPLIKSYVSTSIMNSRYFTGLVPNLLLLFSIGLFCISDKKRKYLVIVFVCYSLINLTIIKNYYFKPHKSQFRETTDHIKSKDNNTLIVSGLGWYYAYFFKDENSGRLIIEKSLEEYVQDLKKDKSKIKEFWYTEGHYRPYTLSIEGQEFLNVNFITKDTIEYYDSWARRYVPKKSVVQIK